ncbi:MAG: polyprenyl synthetase family protein [Ruminococcaceae bacterium]|nr:polyprenyl synthetase family protein [Oscillospiraceae bacterium]
MKDLLQTIKENAELIGSAIDEYLSGSIDEISVLTDSMKYSASSGGKRIRPFLTLEVAKMFGGKKEAALPYACAIEMIHTYSLIHDDLPCMDNDDIRRGKPTNHIVFGEANALLAGDALLTKAFEVAAMNEHVSSDNKVAATILLAQNSGADGMIGGQVLDLAGEKERLSEKTHLMMNRMKTGCLIRTAALLGCLSSGYGEGTDEYADVKKYAENIGLAFQIEDDILDYGTEDNKTTFLSFMSVDEAKAKIDELTGEAISVISKYEGSETLTQFARYLSNREV